jgi:glycerophosphoryl diester phosphodiesterase
MKHHPAIFAHRGARRAAPENTLPAFQAALDMRADGVELDVHCSKDGQLMVIHDFDVDATTNEHGPVSNFTADQLAHMDAAAHFEGGFATTGIPTLLQVLDLIDDRCRINVEVKSMDMLGGDQVEPLLAIIHERDLYDQVIVSSFNPITLIKLRWLDKRVDIGLLHQLALPDYLRAAWLSPIIQPQAVHPYHELVDAEYMAWAKSQGCAVNTWTVNDVDEARRLAALGVDVIMTDKPDVIIAGLA